MTQTLNWGIRSSFLKYLGHSGPHSIAGDRLSPDGPFVFNEISPLNDGERAFEGQIEIKAHGGMLHLILADPVFLVGEEGGGLLEFKVGESLRPVKLLALTPTGQSRWAAHLTEDGTDAFDDVYPAGVPMADVVIEDRDDS